MDNKKSEKTKINRFVFLGVICCVTYASIYLGRLNFSACLNEMLLTGAWGQTQLGGVAAAFFLSYGLGQLPGGFLGDRISPKVLVAIGVTGSALMNIALPFSQSITGMTVIWFLNGLFQALVWPPMAKMVTDMVDSEHSVKLVLALSYTNPLGMLAAYFMSAIFIRYSRWQTCFYGAGVWLFAVALAWWALVSLLERQGTDGKTKESKAPETLRQTEAKERHPFSITPCLVWIALATFFHGVLKDGLTTWIPAYLAGRFSISSSFSVALTMILPIVNLTGVYLAGWSNRRLFQNEAVTGAVSFGIAFIGIVCMTYFSGDSLIGTLSLFALITSMMMSVNTLFISLLPIHFQEEGKVATVSGGLNVLTYLGSSLSSVLFGNIMETAGWPGMHISWLLCAGAGVLLCAAAAHGWGKRRKPIQGEKKK